MNMKSRWLMAAVVLACGGTARLAHADDLDHFRKVEVAADEARILALTGVRELRCDYEIMPAGAPLPIQGKGTTNYQEDLFLFAELYQGGTFVARYRLSLAVDGFQEPKAPRKGSMAFGWNEERHELVSVIQNGQRYSPWTASVVLGDFSCVDHFFFENSHPEMRHSETGTPDFPIYPVVGMCGDRNLKIQEFGFTDAASYLLACSRAHAKNALIIYLYKSEEGENPPLPFNK